MDEEKLVWIVTGTSISPGSYCGKPVIFSAPYSEEDAVADAIYFAEASYGKRVTFTKMDTQSYYCTDPECPVVIVPVDPTSRRSPR